MATIAESPSFEAALAEILQVHDIAQAAPDKLEQAMEAMAKELLKPETTNNLLSEVKKLSDGITRVNNAFTRVGSELGNVDKRDHYDANGKRVPKLQPRWKKYHEHFRTIVWRSKMTATQTAAYIIEFVEVYLPVIEELISTIGGRDMTVPQKRELVGSARAELKRFKENRHPGQRVLDSRRPQSHTDMPGYSQDFLDLAKHLTEFKALFHLIHTEDDPNLASQMECLQRQISELTKEISQYDKLIHRLGDALSATGSSTSSGALAALGILGPQAALAVLLIGALALVAELGALGAYTWKKSKTEKELALATAQMEELQAQLALLDRLRFRLEAQTLAIDDICGRLRMFEDIWTMVAFDAGLAETYLNSAVENAFPCHVSWNFRLVKESYTQLYRALKEYATLVSRSGVPKSVA